MFTEREILTMIGVEQTKRLGRARLIPYCAKAGLIIEAIDDAHASKGRPVYYNIIEDNRICNSTWIDCIYSNNYEVSSDGQVRNKKNKAFVGYVDSKGYVKVHLDSSLQIGIHRLVFFSFNPELFKDEQLYTIDHINGIKTDNCLTNLRPLTRLENCKVMDDNQTEVKGIVAQLLTKYGYDCLIEKLQTLL